MADDQPFPNYPGTRLTRDHIVGYLVPYLQKGWEIYQGDSENQFVVRLADNLKLFIEFVDRRWRVSTGLAPNMSIAIWAYPETLHELDSAIQIGVRTATSAIDPKPEWSALPRAIRLSADEPASNISKIVGLIGSSKVEAVFDAYLDNKSLETLLNFATLGVQISTNVRLLTSTKMVNPSQGLPRLTLSYVRSWITQLECLSAEVRHATYSGHQRRFILLSGGQSLIIGPSLNNLSLNEASHLESDAADVKFFAAEWASATSFPA